MAIPTAFRPLGSRVTATTTHFAYTVFSRPDFTYTWKTYTAPAGATSTWVNLTWGYFAVENVRTDFNLLGITSAGNYAFNNMGDAEASTGQIAARQVSTGEYELDITGRSGAAARDTLFTFVLPMANVVPAGVDITSQEFSITTKIEYIRQASGDCWLGLYVLRSNGTMAAMKLPDSSNANASFLGTEGAATHLLTVPESTVRSAINGDRNALLVILFRDGARGATTTIKSIKVITPFTV